MARLLLVDAMGAGQPFRAELERLHERVSRLISGYLDEAVRQGVIGPIDARVAGQAWFGALHEVVVRWLIADPPGRLEDASRPLRTLLLRGVGVSEERIRGLPDR